MFLDFFQLEEQPFGVTPNPDFLYLGEQYREALATMVYAVRSGRGFHALIAPPGLGKTTLLFRFVTHLRETHKCVFLFNTICNQREFLRMVTSDLELGAPGQDLVEMQYQLNNFLVQTAKEGKNFLLVVDEAQNLHDDVLEMIRLLSNFETPRRKLMHIVLAGQPQLEAHLKQPHLAQLRQRISLVTRLNPLDRVQVHEYVQCRLRLAGAADRQIFLPEALDLVAAFSEGIPRNINNVCFHALSLAFAKGKSTINRDIIEEVIVDNFMADDPRAFIHNRRSEGQQPEHTEAAKAVSLDDVVENALPNQDLAEKVATEDFSEPAAGNLNSPAQAQQSLAFTSVAKQASPGSVKTPQSPAATESTQEDSSEKPQWRLARRAIYAGAIIVFGSLLIFHDLSRKTTSAAPLEPVVSSEPATPATGPVLQNENVASTSDSPVKSDNPSPVGSVEATRTDNSMNPAQPQALRTVVVQANETLWEIGVREFPELTPNDAVDMILQVNEGLKNPKRIRAGQTINLPPSIDESQISVTGNLNSKQPSSSRSDIQ
jgi:type II secretory pathway predicted ATPase ExeA